MSAVTISASGQEDTYKFDAVQFRNRALECQVFTSLQTYSQRIHALALLWSNQKSDCIETGFQTPLFLQGACLFAESMCRGLADSQTMAGRFAAILKATR